MFHVPGLGFDGLVGYSVIQKARESMGLAAGDREGSAPAFFGNGSRAGGVLKHPKSLSETAQEPARIGRSARTRGRKGVPAAAARGGDGVVADAVPPNDAQFLETRQFQVEEICRWFRVQPHKVQHLLHATFSNIEHQSIEFVTDTIRPWLVRFEQEANRKLIRPSQQARLHRKPRRRAAARRRAEPVAGAARSSSATACCSVTSGAPSRTATRCPTGSANGRW
jgi:HK97 family phage portal protein